MSQGSDLFHNDLEQAASLYDLRAILQTVASFPFKHADWKRIASELQGQFDHPMKALPADWEQRTRQFLDTVKTEMAGPAGDFRPDDPEAFYAKYAEQREAGRAYLDYITIQSYGVATNTSDMRDILKEVRTSAELEAFCKTMKNFVTSSEFQGTTRASTVRKVDDAIKILNDAKEQGNFTPETRDRVKKELMGAFYLLDRDAAVPEDIWANYRDVFRIQRDRFQMAEAFRNDLKQAQDAMALKAMLVNAGEFPDERVSAEIKRLNDLFDGTYQEDGKTIAIPFDWEKQARTALTALQDAMEENLVKGNGVSASGFYGSYQAMKKTGISQVIDQESKKSVPGTRTAAFREELEGLQTIDELELYCDLVREIPSNGFSRESVRKKTDSVRETLSEIKERQKGQPFAHYLSEGDLKRVKEELNQALWLMDKDPGLPEAVTDARQVHQRFNDRKMRMDVFDPDADRRHREANPEEHARVVQGRKDWTAARQERISAAAIKNNVADICNLCDKMDKEGSRLFGDSEEYTTMKTAAEKVRALSEKMQESDYHDRDKMVELDKAMQELHAAAEDYAGKKVYGKEKKTGTGVSRKNTALALIELSNVGNTAGIMNGDVQDFRMDKSEKKEAAKRKRGLNELISEEKEKNERTFGNRAKKEEAARRAKEIAQRKKARKENQATQQADTGQKHTN